MKHQEENPHPLNTFYSTIYKRYDIINRLFTFGFDQRWRRITAIECLKNDPVDIIDLCCGTGDLSIKLGRKAKSNVKITGFDLNFPMLDIAKVKSDKNGIPNLDFIQGDVADMPFHDNSFDAMTIGFGFRNLTFENPKARQYLLDMNRILRKGGFLYILESSVPENKIIRLFYNLYLNLFLIPLGTLISGNRKAYSYLARSSAGFFNIQELYELLQRNGFRIEKVRKFFFGASNLIVAVKL